MSINVISTIYYIFKWLLVISPVLNEKAVEAVIWSLTQLKIAGLYRLPIVFLCATFGVLEESLHLLIECIIEIRHDIHVSECVLNGGFDDQICHMLVSAVTSFKMVVTWYPTEGNPAHPKPKRIGSCTLSMTAGQAAVLSVQCRSDSGACLESEWELVWIVAFDPVFHSRVHLVTWPAFERDSRITGPIHIRDRR